MGRHRKQEVLDDGTIVEDIMNGGGDAPEVHAPVERRPRGSREPIKQIIDRFYHTLLSHPDCKLVDMANLKVPEPLRLENVHSQGQRLIELKFVYKSIEENADEFKAPKVDPYGPGGKYYHLIPQRTAAVKSPVTETVAPRPELAAV